MSARGRTVISAVVLAGVMLAAPAQAVTINVALDQLIASGLGDCTPSGPGQCNGTPPDPPVEINPISGHWGFGLPFDQAKLPGATLGPIQMTLPGSIAIAMPAQFAFLAGGTGGGSGGPDPGDCPEAGAGGVLSNLSLSRTITVNGVQHTFAQTGTVRVGWCRDVFTLNSATVAVDTGQGILTVNVAGAAPVVSEGPTTVSLTSPLSGATYSAPANIPLSATASVTIGMVNKVEFYRDGTLVATVLNPPYTATDANVPAGAHTYTAVAYNDEDPNDILLASVAATVTVSGAVAQQQMYFIETDHLNTPRLVANSAGTTIWRWDNTEPFGNSMPNDDPDGDSVPFVFDLRFPGQYFDRETGLAYNWMRDYDPSIGRYEQSDPIGLRGGINTYTYVRGKPLSLKDPTGRDADWWDYVVKCPDAPPGYVYETYFADYSEPTVVCLPFIDPETGRPDFDCLGDPFGQVYGFDCRVSCKYKREACGKSDTLWLKGKCYANKFHKRG